MTNFDFYRPKSAVQFSYKPPVFKIVRKDDLERRYLEEQGAIFIEAANGENRVYDWNNKVKFAIGQNDYSLILGAIANYYRSGKMDLKLLHDQAAGTANKGKEIKTLTITSADKPDTFYFTLSTSTGKRVSVALNLGDILAFETIIKSTMPQALGFVN